MAAPQRNDDDDVPKDSEIAGHAPDVEEEDLGEPPDLHSKYDPSQIRVDSKPFSLHQVVDLIAGGELDLTPDFQRNKVWKPWQKSRLIESIFLRFPLPAFYFAADGDGLLHVVDGLQRISTIYDFVKGGDDFNTLSGLEYMTIDQLGGLTWETLGGAWKRRLNMTQIFAHVIDPQTPFQVKFQIFQRLNQNGVPLNAQEIRNSISRKRSRDFLRGLAKSKSFLTATAYALADNPRMADLEAVLRVCAFRMEADIGPYASFDSLDDFLTAASRRLDQEQKFPASRLEQLRADFERAMQNGYRLFGRHAFRKWLVDQARRFQLSKPLLESWGCVLADYEWEQLAPHKEAIVTAFRTRLQEDSAYRDAISFNTASRRNVSYRLEVARAILTEHLS